MATFWVSLESFGRVWAPPGLLTPALPSEGSLTPLDPKRAKERKREREIEKWIFLFRVFFKGEDRPLSKTLAGSMLYSSNSQILKYSITLTFVNIPLIVS